jgi:hypothetical protein
MTSTKTTLRMFNGLQIDVPDGWADVSTVVIAPRDPLRDGKKPSINLVVKRRPCEHDETEKTLQGYLKFMQSSFGEVSDVQTKEMMAGNIRGKAIRLSAVADQKKFSQVTFLYHTGGEEVSASVTQMHGDLTPIADIEKLLKSVRPAAGGVRGLR